MRKQYFFRSSDRGLLAWDVDRLILLTASFDRRRVPLTHIRELDDDWCGEGERPTWRAMVAHLQLIDDADLAFPIILASDGAVMDGMHRVAKAVRHGHDDIVAVQFERDPEPDHVGRSPDDLPY